MLEARLNILAIETSSRLCQVALQANGEQYERKETSNSHSTVILSLVDELLVEAGIKTQDLHLIAVTQGPGSFTGLRVGIAVVQGLAFAHRLLTLPLSSLTLTAWEWFKRLESHSTKTDQLGSECIVLATIDARMSQLYNAWFAIENDAAQVTSIKPGINPCSIKALSPERVTSPELIDLQAIQNTEFGSFSVAGSGAIYCEQFPAALCGRFTIDAEVQPTAIGMLDYLSYFNEGELRKLCIEPEALAPVYIRDDVTS